MSRAQSKPIAVLGAGSWGTALALYLARRQIAVRLWTHRKDQAIAMLNEGCNSQYLPLHTFPSTLSVSHDLCESIVGCQNILIATPSVAFRSLVQQLKPLLNLKQRIVWATKGLDREHGQMLHDVATGILGHQYPLAILSGPSFAREVADGLPTAVVIASLDEVFGQELIQIFNSQIFRVYYSDDLAGVELCGVAKNVLAIAAGICDGMQLGANARTALITRGLAEMTRLGLAIGGKPETFTGLAGVGDLILTCTDNQSRNKRFGLAIGQGKTATEAKRHIGQVVEGADNAALIEHLAIMHQVEMPIVSMVLKILRHEVTPGEAVDMLLRRGPRSE